MFISDHDISATSEAAAVAAIKDYESISKGDHRDMPEYWVTCRIASDLAGKGLVVECEKRIGEIIGGIGEIISDKPSREKIDIAVYVTAEDNPNRPRGLIEIKGSQSRWDTFGDDFVRLRTTAKSLRLSDLLIGLVYATCPMRADKLMEERLEMKRQLGLAEPKKVTISKQQSSGNNDFWEIMSVFERAV